MKHVLFLEMGLHETHSLRTDVVADSLIWSHYHWDHCGDTSQFPTSTEIVVGPGFKKNLMPGWPTNAKAMMLDSDTANHEVREVIFDGQLKIGGFPAHDFFGDGSLYLLDSPGHAIGHMCGLARTSPDTFVFMGGDICHFVGNFRPSRTIPLPDPLASSTLDVGFPSPCPCSLFTSLHPVSDHQEARRLPFYSVTDRKPRAYVNKATADASIAKMQEFDENPNVLVCIAHDPVLLDVLPTLNHHPQEDINDWKARGWKEKCHWGFLNELPRNGKPGRKPIVEGFWRDGRQSKI